jgi:Gamma-glutamyltranspeptidase
MSTPWLKVCRAAQLAFVATLLAACGGNDDIVDTIGENACLQYSSTGAVYNPGTPGENGAPEIATGFASKKTAYSRSYMVVANNPLATKAGCDVLRAGGSAVDAAVAVQMVLNLVEPQSSGIGGGAFMLYYDRAKGTVTAYDAKPRPLQPLKTTCAGSATPTKPRPCPTPAPAAAASARRGCWRCWTWRTKTVAN